MTPPVLVVGAGLAGLSLARTLLARQIPFRVLEASPQLPKYSYGLTLLPWAYEPLVSKLNLAAATELRRATATDSPNGGAGCIHPVYANVHSGHDVLTPDVTAKPPLSYRCSRTRLTDLLAHDLDIEFDKKLKHIDSSSEGVCLHFEDGSTVEGSLAVGADGVHSAGL